MGQSILSTCLENSSNTYKTNNSLKQKNNNNTEKRSYDQLCFNTNLVKQCETDPLRVFIVCNHHTTQVVISHIHVAQILCRNVQITSSNPIQINLIISRFLVEEVKSVANQNKVRENCKHLCWTIFAQPYLVL